MRIPGVVLLASIAAACADTAAPTSPTTVAAEPAAELFESIIYPRGSASRQITMSTGTTLTVTLNRLSPPATVGFALGLSRLDGGGCYVTDSVEVSETPVQISRTVDAGSYCVRIYDLGLLLQEVAFSITITRGSVVAPALEKS